MASNGDSFIIDINEVQERGPRTRTPGLKLQESSSEKKSEDDARMWKHLLRKDFLKTPKEFHRGQNIDEYIKTIKEYCEAIGASNDDRLYIMVNNLDDEVKYELFALPEYANHATSVEWVESMLIQLHKVKVTEVTPLIELMNIRQGESQNITDFASRLRVKAFQLMGHEDPQKREKFLLKAFIKGLQDRRLATGIQIMDPDTLAEAIEVAKREKGGSKKRMYNEDAICAIVNSRNDKSKDEQMAAMGREISMLREKIDYLISIITNEYRKRENGNRNNTSGRQQMLQKTRKSDITCFNCNFSGHLARDCRRPCKICKLTGHTSYNCIRRRPRPREHVRALQDLQETNSDNVEIDDRSSIGSQAEEDNQCDEIYCFRENTCREENQGRKDLDTRTLGMHKTKENQPKRRSYKEVLMNGRKSQSGKQEKRLDNWVQYISGNGNKPRKHYVSSATVITNRRPELAANKPIVKAKCNGLPVKIFCDSGAECNTIDLTLFNKIKKSQPELTVYDDNSKIKCASGTLIDCVGIVNLCLSLGGRQSIHPFKIIPNMFPELIAGIKLMKSMEIRVNPAKDCVEVGQSCVPFLSTVKEENVGEQGNERAPFYRAIKRC